MGPVALRARKSARIPNVRLMALSGSRAGVAPSQSTPKEQVARRYLNGDQGVVRPNFANPTERDSRSAPTHRWVKRCAEASYTIRLSGELAFLTTLDGWHNRSHRSEGRFAVRSERSTSCSTQAKLQEAHRKNAHVLTSGISAMITL